MFRFVNWVIEIQRKGSCLLCLLRSHCSSCSLAGVVVVFAGRVKSLCSGVWLSLDLYQLERILFFDWIL